MKRQVLRVTALFSLFLLVVVSASSQGVYWESTISGTPAGDQVSQMFYMPKMFKHVARTSGEQMIVRLDKQMVYTIDPKAKTYSEMTFAELEAGMKKAGSQTNAKMEELQKQLESMPPEQRKAIEQQMGGMLPGKGAEPKFEVSTTGEKKPIGGYSCSKFLVTRDGKEFMTLWATKEIKDFDAMKKDFEEYGKRMSGANEMMGKGMLAAMKKVDGFPMETDIMGMSTVVTKVEKRSTPLSEFNVPAGYTKVKSKMFEGLDEKE